MSIVMKKSHPALHDGPMGWKWVLLGELAEIMNRRPWEVWERFFPLSKDVDLIAVVVNCKFHNVSPGGEISGTIDTDNRWQYAGGGEWEFRQVILKRGQLFVPAGWALQVLEAHKKGVFRVERWACTVDPYSNTPDAESCNPGTLACNLWMGHQVDAVGLDANGSPVV